MQPDGAVGSRPSPVPVPTRPAPVPTRPAPSLVDLKPAPSIPTQATNKGMYFNCTMNVTLHNSHTLVLN